MATFRIDKYRDIYIRFDKFPYHRLTGKNTMLYTGNIITNVTKLPDSYDSKKDYFFSCECDYPSYREVRKI